MTESRWWRFQACNYSAFDETHLKYFEIFSSGIYWHGMWKKGFPRRHDKNISALMYYSIWKETTPNWAFRVLSSYSKNRCIIRIFSHTRFVRCYLRELLFRKNRKAESIWRFTFKSGSSNILNIYSNKNSRSQRLCIFWSIWYDFTRNSSQMYLIYENGIAIDWRRDIVYFIRDFFVRCHRFFSFAGLASFSNRFGCHNSYRIPLNKTACMAYLDESERVLWHTEMYKYITHINWRKSVEGISTFTQSASVSVR